MLSKAIAVLILGLILFPLSASALEISLTSPPASIDTGQSADFGVSLTCPACSDSYLRGVFFSAGTNYFGLTQNQNGEFIGTSGDKTLYYLVAKDDLVSGSWSGVLKVKVDSDSSYYIGPGSYSFKVIRYTPSGSKSGETTPVTITLTGSIPPTPTSPVPPTVTPGPLPSSTQVPRPTFTPAPTRLPTRVVQVLALADPPVNFTPVFTTVSASPSVSSPRASSAAASSTPSLALPLVLWFSGLVIILGSLYLFFT